MQRPFGWRASSQTVHTPAQDTQPEAQCYPYPAQPQAPSTFVHLGGALLSRGGRRRRPATSLKNIASVACLVAFGRGVWLITTVGRSNMHLVAPRFDKRGKSAFAATRVALKAQRPEGAAGEAHARVSPRFLKDFFPPQHGAEVRD